MTTARSPQPRHGERRGALHPREPSGERRLGRSQQARRREDRARAVGVSLEFDSYFFFLRKFHYIAMDREAQLKLTDQGERVVDGATTLDKFSAEVSASSSPSRAPRSGEPPPSSSRRRVELDAAAPPPTSEIPRTAAPQRPLHRRLSAEPRTTLADEPLHLLPQPERPLAPAAPAAPPSADPPPLPPPPSPAPAGSAVAAPRQRAPTSTCAT